MNDNFPLLLTPYGVAARPLLDLPHLRFVASCVETMVREQGAALVCNEDPSARVPFNLDEHDYLRTEFPLMVAALKIALSAVESGNVFRTPGGLILQKNMTEGFWTVQKLFTGQYLRGFTEYKPGLPIEWLTVQGAVSPPEFQVFQAAIQFRGTFWQVWETALRAETESLALPFGDTAA